MSSTIAFPNYLGITPNQYPDPFKVQRYSGLLRIVGSGRCVWDDLMSAPQGDVMCVNDMIMHYPDEIQHAYSNDNRMLHKWWEARRPRYRMDQGTPLFHSCNDISGYRWPFPGHGTSGLGAVYVGLALGYDEIVLCGIPMDGSGHYFDPPQLKTNYTSGMRFWQKIKDLGKVYSQSGNTRELLGAYNDKFNKEIYLSG